MGVLNPWLYTVGKFGLKDIVDGGSGGCYGASKSELGSAFVLYAGWNATDRSDPVKGLGTPLFQLWLKWRNRQGVDCHMWMHPTLAFP